SDYFPSLVTFLFFLSSGRRRHVPSFPTRRSSDLGGRHGVEGAAGRARLRAHLAHLLFLAEPILEGHEGGLLAPPLLELAVAQAADRKSTRLNSSHVAISYAVFCLKKKNLTHAVAV